MVVSGGERGRRRLGGGCGTAEAEAASAKTGTGAVEEDDAQSHISLESLL